jgi:hypothetical protein
VKENNIISGDKKTKIFWSAEEPASRVLLHWEVWDKRAKEGRRGACK